MLREQVPFAITVMQHLEWIINFSKSVLVPTQYLEFLGVTCDAQTNTKSLSKPKCLTLRRALLKQISQGSWSIRQAQSLMGRLGFASFIFRRGRLPKSRPHQRFAIPEQVLAEMSWWVKAVPAHHHYMRNPFHICLRQMHPM